MVVGYVWRVRADLVRQISLGFESCVREVDAFFARTAPSGRPVTSPRVASSSSTDTTKQETSTSLDRDDDNAIREHLIRRLTHCSAGLRRTSASSSFEAASSTVSLPTSPTSTGVNQVPNVHLDRNPITSLLSTSPGFRRFRRDDIDENFRRHSVARSSRVVSGRVMRVTSSHVVRPLRDVNGNLPMRFKTSNDRWCRSVTLMTHADAENNYSMVASSAAVLPLTSDHHHRRENVGVERRAPTDVDIFVDAATTGCGNDSALDSRACHEDVRWRQLFTSGCIKRSVPKAVVVKVEPNESQTNDVWRPW